MIEKDYDLNDIVEMKKLENHTYGSGYPHQVYGLWNERAVSQSAV